MKLRERLKVTALASLVIPVVAIGAIMLMGLVFGLVVGHDDLLSALFSTLPQPVRSILILAAFFFPIMWIAGSGKKEEDKNGSD